MARVEYDGFERIDGVLTRLSRDAIREVVMAGAAACVEETKKNILQYRHVVTGSMMEGVAAGKYHEDVGSGWVEVGHIPCIYAHTQKTVCPIHRTV